MEWSHLYKWGKKRNIFTRVTGIYMCKSVSKDMREMSRLYLESRMGVRNRRSCQCPGTHVLWDLVLRLPLATEPPSQPMLWTGGSTWELTPPRNNRQSVTDGNWWRNALSPLPVRQDDSEIIHQCVLCTDSQSSLHPLVPRCLQCGHALFWPPSFPVSFSHSLTLWKKFQTLPQGWFLE